ncbi:hypothetical protein GW17_00017406 [Ensete ventricosum]|nr:hypothetical protein GW17_00017406 [Ensete ventricosum]
MATNQMSSVLAAKERERGQKLTRQNPVIEDVKRDDRLVLSHGGHKARVVINAEIILEPHQGRPAANRLTLPPSRRSRGPHASNTEGKQAGPGRRNLLEVVAENGGQRAGKDDRDPRATASIGPLRLWPCLASLCSSHRRSPLIQSSDPHRPLVKRATYVIKIFNVINKLLRRCRSGSSSAPGARFSREREQERRRDRRGSRRPRHEDGLRRGREVRGGEERRRRPIAIAERTTSRRRRVHPQRTTSRSVPVADRSIGFVRAKRIGN